MGGGVNLSHIANTSFRGVYSRYSGAYGGVLYVNTSSSTSFIMTRCLFISCVGAYYGGVLYLGSVPYSIMITQCRFENNTASSSSYYGADIYASSSSCGLSTTTVTESCSSSPGTTVYCSSTSISVLVASCGDEIVCCFVLFSL
jgi:parallel beta-helix repeat protein